MLLLKWGGTPAFIFCLFLLDGIGLTNGAKVCTYNAPSCTGPNCIQENECVYGDCNEEGRCECLPCFTGDTCNEYSDRYGPRFHSEEETVVHYIGSNDPLYVAKARDDDLGLTCNLGAGPECRCGVIKYGIRESNADDSALFSIDPSSGLVTLKDGVNLQVDRPYELTLIASNVISEEPEYQSVTHQDVQALKVIARNSDSVEQLLAAQDIPQPFPMLNETMEQRAMRANAMDSHIRRKRLSAGADNDKASTKCTLTEDTTAPAAFQPGNSVEYTLTCILPTLSTAMDMVIEVFVMDAVSGETPFALCDPRVESVGSSITDDTDTPLTKEALNANMEKKKNTRFPLIYDRAVFPVGSVKNGDSVGDGTTNTGNSEIVIKFTAVAIYNPDYSNDTVIVTVGAEYDAENFVWVSQASHPKGAGGTSYTSEFGMTLEGTGEEVAQFAGRTFTIEAKIGNPWDTLTVELFTGSLEHDKFSFSNLHIASQGAKWACMPPDGSSITYHKSVSGRTDHRVVFTLQLLLKELDYAALGDVLTDDAFKITFGFSIFVLDGVSGDVLNISAAALIGTDSIWTASMPLTVTAGSLTPAAGDPSAFVAEDISNTVVGAGGTVTFGAKATIPDGANALLSCTVAGNAESKVCAVKIGKAGKNIAYLPDMSEIVVIDDAAGTASFEVNINSTGPGDNDVVFEVSIHYPNGNPGPVVIDCNGISFPLTATSGNNGLEDVSGESISLLSSGDTNWYLGSAAGMLIKLKFPAGGVPYNALIFEAAGDLEISGWGARVCKAEIVSVGDGVPCIYGKKKEATEGAVLQKAKDDSSFEDSVKMDLGSSCGVNRLSSVESDFEVQLRVIYEIPINQAGAPATENFNLSAGMSLDSDLIWTAWNTLSFSLAPPSAADTSLPPIFSFVDGTAQTAFIGIPYVAKVNLKLQPQFVGVIKIIVTPSDPAILSVCKVVFLGIGENFPCVDPEPYGKHLDPGQITTVIHDEADWGAGVTLDLGVLRNPGTLPIFSDNIADADTIALGVLVKGVAAGAATLTVQLDDTGTTTDLTQDFTISGPDPAIGTLTFAVAGDEGNNNAYVDVMKLVNVELTIPPNYGRVVVIKVTNAAPAVAGLCFGHVFVVGLNMPCVIPAMVEPVRNSTDTEEFVYIDLKQVCHYPISTNDTENIITAKFGMIFVDPDATSADFSVSVFEGDSELGPETVTITKITDPFVADNVTEGMKLELLDNTTMTVVQGERVSIAVAFTMPPFVTLPLELGIMTPTDEGRAYVTVHGFGFRAGGGKNLGCLLDDFTLYDTKLVQNSSFDTPMIHDSQTDTLVSGLKFITNTGISVNHGNQKVEDDQLFIQGDFLVADHPNATIGGTIIFDISFAVKAGNLIFVIEKQITLTRTGSEKLDVGTELEITDDTASPFQPLDQINFRGFMYHDMNKSQEEANDAKARLYMPKYLSFVNDSGLGLPLDIWSSNISGVATHSTYIDFDIKNLFFTDILEMNFSLTVDPNGLLPKGLGEVNATTLLRLVCTTNNEPTAHYCGNTSFATFQLYGPDCFDPLGLDTMQDCQLSASTAIGTPQAPSMAKWGSGGGWSPAVRGGSGWVHHITVDFLKKTRVTKLVFGNVASSRKVTQFKMQYSHSGKSFTEACPNVLDVVNNECVLPLACRFEARYGRVVIVAADGVEGASPIGVTFNWFGCPIETVDGTCDATVTTPLTDTTVGWRHVAYDPLNLIFYFCDYLPKKARVQCYSSVDGDVWNALPSYIGRLIGFDAAGGRMCAKDRKERSMVCSTDGINWGIEDAATAATLEAAIDASADKAQPVPGQVEAMLSPVAFGSWSADYTGISLSGAYKAKWATCCS